MKKILFSLLCTGFLYGSQKNQQPPSLLNHLKQLAEINEKIFHIFMGRKTNESDLRLLGSSPEEIRKKDKELNDRALEMLEQIYGKEKEIYEEKLKRITAPTALSKEKKEAVQALEQARAAFEQEIAYLRDPRNKPNPPVEKALKALRDKHIAQLDLAPSHHTIEHYKRDQQGRFVHDEQGKRILEKTETINAILVPDVFSQKLVTLNQQLGSVNQI